MSNLEAIADAATGAVIGRAVEPRAGESAAGHTDEATCLNCGSALVGDYCHCCGQRAHVHRTLSSFFHDLLHGVFHFEGKIWHTVPMLAWRPGELTRHYIDGQRARFVSPMALFLFSVFLMFGAISAMGISGAQVTNIHSQLAANIVKDEAALTKATALRADLVRTGKPIAAIDQRIAGINDDLKTERLMAEKGVAAGTTARISDNVPGWLRTGIDKAREDPGLLLFKMKTNAYKFSWALIPISVPFVWLLFPFSRRFRLYDHTVFVTYSLSFMTLLVVAATLLSPVIGSATSALMFVPPVHMYRQLQGAYQLGRIGALWRTVALTIFAFFASALFVILLIALGLFE